MFHSAPFIVLPVHFCCCCSFLPFISFLHLPCVYCDTTDLLSPSPDVAVLTATHCFLLVGLSRPAGFWLFYSFSFSLVECRKRPAAYTDSSTCLVVLPACYVPFVCWLCPYACALSCTCQACVLLLLLSTTYLHLGTVLFNGVCVCI